MPELPGPPEDYDEAQRRAWIEGAATVAGLLGQQGQIIASRYGDAFERGDDGEGGTDGEGDAGDSNDEPATCPDCGDELLEGMGGSICPSCGT